MEINKNKKYKKDLKKGMRESVCVWEGGRLWKGAEEEKGRVSWFTGPTTGSYCSRPVQRLISSKDHPGGMVTSQRSAWSGF